MSTHIVHKQKVDLKIARSEDSFSLQSRVSYLLQHELPKKMEMIFDKVVPDDEIIRIDKLQLDLHTINSENFEKEFEERFIEELQNELSKIRDNVSRNNNVVAVNKEDSLLHSLIHFLEHGYLTWYNSVTQIKLWEEEILHELSPKEWEYFLNWLKRNYVSQVIERLVLQFSEDFLQQLVLKTNLYPRDFKNVYEDLLLILQTFSEQKKADRIFLWKEMLYVFLKEADEAEYKIIRSICRKEVPENSLTALKEKEITEKIKTPAVRKAFEKFIETPDKRERLFFEEDVRPKQKKQQIEEALYVKNCGIVILHPFLEMYFTELEVMRNKKFLSDEASKRSVLLLHYLAAGETEVAEFDLVLQKILCGLSLEETLPSAIELSEKEIAESENLLRSVMNYWPPLKNTSIAGLQQTFLQRDGKLSQTERGWLLRIEQKTVDILLGKLPWGFSTIQLPWMNDILSVEWC